MSDKEKQKELGESLMLTLSDSMEDIGIDIAQVAVSELLENTQNEILGQLPVVKSLYAIGKTGFAFRDYLFLKKLLQFIALGQSADDEIKKRYKEAVTNLKVRKEIGEHLINILDRLDQLNKTDALFKIYSAYLKGNITHKEFLGYSYVLLKIDFDNIEVLKEFYCQESSLSRHDGTYDIDSHLENYPLNNFAFAGLLAIGGKGLRFGGFIGFSKNNFGEKFLKILNLL